MNLDNDASQFLRWPVVKTLSKTNRGSTNFDNVMTQFIINERLIKAVFSGVTPLKTAA